MARTIKVECTLIVEIQVDDGREDDLIRYQIEESGCPGTGDVGAAIDAVYKDGEERGVCWACNLKGRNKIIEGLVGDL